MTNVLLLVWDAVRAKSTSLHGYERSTTPFLEDFASDATVYTNARTASPWSLPSHASMFTGLVPREHGATRKNPVLDDEAPHLAGKLSEAGYDTGLFTANRYLTLDNFGLNRGFNVVVDSNNSVLFPDALNPREFTMDRGTGKNREFLLEAVRGDNPLKSLLNGAYKKLDQTSDGYIANADEHVDSFLKWVDDRQKWFATINLVDTHTPYHPPEGFRKWVSEDEDNWLDYRTPDKWGITEGSTPVSTLETSEDLYDCCISYVDAVTESLVERLKQRGLYDDTLIVVTSDHGECFGEPALFGEYPIVGHSSGIREELQHVPLVIKYPDDDRAGVQRSELVSLRSIYKTIINETIQDGGLTLKKPGAGRNEMFTEREGVFYHPDIEESLSSYDFPNELVDRPARAYYAFEDDTLWKVVWGEETEKRVFEITESEIISQENGEHDILSDATNYVENFNPRRDSNNDADLDEKSKSLLEDLGYI